MTKIAWALLCLVLCGVSFWFGAKWKRATLGESSKFVLSEDLELQVSPGVTGSLPKGTVLYEYRSMSETTTYYLFINLKEIDVVNVYRGVDAGKSNLIVPVSAYPKEKEDDRARIP